MFEKLNKKKWFHSVLVGLVGVGGIIYAAYLSFSVYHSNKENLITHTNTLAQFISAKDIAILSGSEDDLNNPAYIKIKNQLMSLQSVDTEARFIYLVGIKRDKIFFYVDSEDPQSEDYSNPGQEYYEASEMMRSLFTTKENGFEVARDRWGIWASALVPIIDGATGDVVALLGVDVSAGKYIGDIAAYSLSAILFSAFIVALIMSQQRVIKNMQIAQKSLNAKNFEVMHMNKVLSERELKMDELKKEIDEIKKGVLRK